MWEPFKIGSPLSDVLIRSIRLVSPTDAALRLLNPLGFDIERDYLFVFQGIAIVNGVAILDGQLDFLVLQGIGTELRVVLAEGEEIFFFSPEGNPNEFELRTLNETWQCDVGLRRCLSTGGTQISW